MCHEPLSTAADESEAVLMDIAAETLRRDGVLLSVHLFAANDRCAAQVSHATYLTDETLFPGWFPFEIFAALARWSAAVGAPVRRQ